MGSGFGGVPGSVTGDCGERVGAVGVLTEADKALNRLISSCRILVERAIGGMKRFRAVSNIYRNKQGWDDNLVYVTAGLWNFHLLMKNS